MSEWISVKDKLPDGYGNYIGLVEGEVTEVTFDERDKWSTCDAYGFRRLADAEITHWMPLPEPPKEDKL